MLDRQLPSHRIVVLGASGQLGSRLVNALETLAPDAEVVCTSRSEVQSGKASRREWIRFDPFSDDWRILGSCQVLVNCIGAIDPGSLGFEEIHVGLVERILANREMLGFPRIVQLSALGAHREHETDFLRTKGLADSLLAEQPNCIVIKPSIVCTPGTMLSKKLGQLLYLSRFSFGKVLVPAGFPATLVQPVMGSDLGEVMALACLRPNVPQLLDVVGPDRLSFGKIMEIMASAQNREIKIIGLPRDIIATFVKHFVAVWLPGLLNYDQFLLLFEDNIGEVEPITRVLGRAPVSTLTFWESEAGPFPKQPSEEESPEIQLERNPMNLDVGY